MWLRGWKCDQPQLLSLSKQTLKGSGVGVLGVDGCSEDSRSKQGRTAQVINREVARPIQDFLIWGGGWQQCLHDGKIILHHLTSLLHGPRPHWSLSLLNSSTSREIKKNLHRQNMNHPHGTFHRNERNGGCTKGDKMTLQHCHQVVRNECLVCLCASCGSLNTATLLTLELEANLPSVAQLDVQP